MYILVKESVPNGKAVVGVAHASLGCYLKFKDTAEMKEWLDGPFYKTVCHISEQEFEQAKKVGQHVVITESTLDDNEIVIAFSPRTIYPKEFQYYRLFK